jgi:hypothetical protein
MLDPDKLYEKMVQAGDEWADLQSAANVLEDTRHTVLSRLMQKSQARSVAAQEVEARASVEYEDHVKAAQEAAALALKAKVKYEAIKVWVDLKRTEAANERAAMNLR